MGSQIRFYKNFVWILSDTFFFFSGMNPIQHLLIIYVSNFYFKIKL